MADREALYQILDYILNKATSDELGVIAEALKRRTSQHRGLGGIDPRGMAERMAKNVKEQLGKLGDIGEIARKMVTDMIREKEPGISDRDLEVLLDTWLPGTRSDARSRGEPSAPDAAAAGATSADTTSPAGLAPDVLVTMVSQFVAGSQGTLSEQEQRELPKGWREQYWESFPHPVRELINEHLHGRLGEVEFWQHLVKSLEL
ncbi:MAG: hypothetical protein JW820_19850 [Spirochaetales bacterium]|nr:hypothetical protein [Spirochaetales bacterium]